jgi:CspA family cold shock protein
MMHFADKMLTCQQCGATFVFTVTEQRQIYESGTTEIFEPRFCPTCRSVGEGVKLIGRVKWYSPEKGYGFISKADGEDIFVHRSGMESEGTRFLEEGQQVEFEIEKTARGPQAVHVAPLPEDSN